jgi:hypothetical protein
MPTMPHMGINISSSNDYAPAFFNETRRPQDTQ